MAPTTQRLLALEARVKKWTRGIAMLGLICLLIQAIAIVTDVAMRWLFNSPLFGMEDINGMLITVIIASFFPALLIERGNVTINFLGMFLGSAKAEWLNAFGQFVTLLFFIVATWQMALYCLFVAPQTTLILELPVMPVWLLTALLISLCIPVQLLVFLLHLHAALSGREYLRENSHV